MLREWDKLPKNMRTEAVRPYYESLKKKKVSLALKRAFDVIASTIMIVILSPLLIIISVLIVTDSKGGVFYRQERVTQYGKKFRIFKFRTMVANADKIGTQVTVSNDNRITRIGSVIRKYRIDGYDIIGQTRKSLENRGFRKVSPMNFLDNHTRFGWYSCDMRIATV